MFAEFELGIKNVLSNLQPYLIICRIKQNQMFVSNSFKYAIVFHVDIIL